jgi:hypothetical protein
MSEDRAVELKYKEILYFCLEELKATKAALYILGPDGDFHLKAAYGFARSDALPGTHPKGSPLVEALYMERKPFYINSLQDAGDIKPLLQQANTTRMMVSPIYVERIAGFLDIRDKAGKAPFDDNDILAGDGIALRYAKILTSHKRKDVLLPPLVTEALPAFERPSQEIPILDNLYSKVAALTTAPAPRILQPFAEPSPSLQASCCRLIELCLTHPDFLTASFSIFTPKGCYMVTGGRQALPQDILQRLAAEGRASIASRLRMEPGQALFIKNHFPLGESTAQVHAYRVLSTALVLQSEAAVLFNYFALKQLSREELQGLGPFLNVAKNLVRLEVDNALTGQSFYAILEKFLEPGLTSYSSLKLHSLMVADLVRSFCTVLHVEARETERITLAGLLHDVGMRELDYVKLYHKKSLADDEYRLLQQHPKVGAYLIQDVPFPCEIYSLVLHHHERWDGSGYPDQVLGEAIPFGARIIHILEAYDAMTSKTSYRPCVEAGQALEILRSKAGVQFDPALIQQFIPFIQSHEGLKGPHPEPQSPS